MKLKQALPVLLAIGLITIGSTVIAFAKNSPEARTALINKDYNGFKAAIVGDAQKRANNLTQEQFDKMSTHEIALKATQDAIKANDYEAFKKSADSKLLAKVNSQELFTKLVNFQKDTDAVNTKIENAIKNNDFNAFKQAHKELFDLRESNKPSESNDMMNSKHKPTPTETQLQTRFDELVAKFKADGSLPTTSNGFEARRKGFDRGKLGTHGAEFKNRK